MVCRGASNILFGLLNTWPSSRWDAVFCRYEGEFVEGKMDGQGVYTFEDGGCFTGEFRNNKKDGRGCMVTKDGEKWEGVWVNDSRQGTVSVFPVHACQEMQSSHTSKNAPPVMKHPMIHLILHCMMKPERFTGRPHWRLERGRLRAEVFQPKF
jgi:hypothetical protein